MESSSDGQEKAGLSAQGALLNPVKLQYTLNHAIDLSTRLQLPFLNVLPKRFRLFFEMAYYVGGIKASPGYVPFAMNQ
jgi:hypothetical protein